MPSDAACGALWRKRVESERRWRSLLAMMRCAARSCTSASVMRSLRPASGHEAATKVDDGGRRNAAAVV